MSNLTLCFVAALLVGAGGCSLSAQQPIAPAGSNAGSPDTPPRGVGKALEQNQSTQPVQAPPVQKPPDVTTVDQRIEVFYSIACSVYLLLGLGMLFSYRALKRAGDWGLASALSEKSPETMRAAIAVAQTTLQLNAAANPGPPAPPVPPLPIPAPPVPIPVTPVVSSSSRVAMLIGLLVMSAVMLGLGMCIIWGLVVERSVPKLDGIGTYLLGGAALFAPYAFNQLKEVFVRP